MSAKDTLRSNKTKILDILRGDPTLIRNKIQEKNLITDREYDNLKHITGGNREVHVVELVDKIFHKGEKTCQDFLNLLQTDVEVRSTYPELTTCTFQPTSAQAPSGDPSGMVTYCFIV